MVTEPFPPSLRYLISTVWPALQITRQSKETLRRKGFIQVEVRFQIGVRERNRQHLPLEDRDDITLLEPRVLRRRIPHHTRDRSSIPVVTTGLPGVEIEPQAGSGLSLRKNVDERTPGLSIRVSTSNARSILTRSRLGHH